METSREDVGIAIRSAFLRKDTKQRFSLFVLFLISIFFIFLESIESKPLNYLRSFIKDVTYKSSELVTFPGKSLKKTINYGVSHIDLYEKYNNLKIENDILKNKVYRNEFLNTENNKLKKLINEQTASYSNLIGARVIFDKRSPYLNSFIINIGTNKNIKKGMAVLDGKNFIGRIVDVNFFSSRVLLVSDLNSRIPVMIESSATQAILSGHGIEKPTLDYLPENHNINLGNRVFTSGKEGIFEPGIPVGKTIIENKQIKVSLFSALNQLLFVNVSLGDVIKNK